MGDEIPQPEPPRHLGEVWRKRFGRSWVCVTVQDGIRNAWTWEPSGKWIAYAWIPDGGHEWSLLTNSAASLVFALWAEYWQEEAERLRGGIKSIARSLEASGFKEAADAVREYLKPRT